MGQSSSKKVSRSAGKRCGKDTKAGRATHHGSCRVDPIEALAIKASNVAQAKASVARALATAQHKIAERDARACFAQQALGYARKGAKLTDLELKVLKLEQPESLALYLRKQESRQAGQKIASSRKAYAAMAAEISNDKQFDAELEEMDYAAWAEKVSSEAAKHSFLH